ncbi:hypothetical protein KSP35_13905 [Aquihabitans sp. G128]|uniref:hypothetical protein n=1 Tax=Aquihabitans sp. G128 TaxID=2849779 RepID=UPI001C23F9E5|nr:hypothetical protein [Aquihabitans sp. G128]QXC59488.1 hypothetical protein KSP35_13905 [Aquihabitans sp. G128]
MFKTGSKFLLALAGFGYAVAFLWAGTTGNHTLGMDSLIGPLTLGYKGYVGEHVGFTILVGLSASSLFLGIFLAALRDSDAEAVAQVAGLDAVPAVEPPATVNYWPVVAAFSLGALVLGLAIGPLMFTIGLIGLIITTVEWAVRAWSDRATGDAEVNRTIRNRFMYPVEIPALAVIGVGGLVLAISRVLLALPKYGSYAVFGLVPVLVFLVGLLIVNKPKLSQSVIAGLLLVGGVALLAGGVAAAIHGERKHAEEHEEKSGEAGLAPLPSPSQTVIQVGNR